MLGRLMLRELWELRAPGVVGLAPRAVFVAALFLVSAVLLTREHPSPAVPVPGRARVSAARAGGLRGGAAIRFMTVVSTATTLGGATPTGTAAVRAHLPAVAAGRGRGYPWTDGDAQVPAHQKLRYIVSVETYIYGGVESPLGRVS